METNEIVVQKKLEDSLNLAKDVITKEYLCKLSEWEVAELPEELKDKDVIQRCRIFKFKKLVSDKNENTIDKLVTVLNAVYSNKETIFTMICGHKNITEYYLGVVNKDIDSNNTLESTLKGNFPGLSIEKIVGEKKRNLLKETDKFKQPCITAISGIASVRNEKDMSYEKFVQGTEHLVDSLQGKEYCILILADPVSTSDLENARFGYEQLYTQLSPFLRTTVSINKTKSVTQTQAQTSGITETISRSSALTQNYAETTGWSSGENHNASNSKNIGQIIGAVLGIALQETGIDFVTKLLKKDIGINAGVSGSLIVGGITGTDGNSTGSFASQNESTTNSHGETTTQGMSKSRQESYTNSEAKGTTEGKSAQYVSENRIVKGLLEKIDKNIERLEKCEAYGGFNCAVYVISSDPQTNAEVESSYNALMRGDSSATQSSHMNSWTTEGKNGERVKQYLDKYTHPRFICPDNEQIRYSPALLTNAYELAVNMGFPKKSISGLPVYEMIAFGRNVQENGAETDALKLGDIYHMGMKQDGISVNLNLNSLAMHTFITGSTGSGKSNTVYHILSNLQKQNVHFLVIEPAKGEYKNVFGHGEAVVYGTNPDITPLLRLNPFKFPTGIHVLEHVDRLIEIFNVCWPMYAAMPAVLKEAVLKAYEICGWDLTTSRNMIADNLYPSFQDLLEQLDVVIDESGYSDEVKSNYKGSLITRVKSLTNGLNGMMFSQGEIDNAILFDSNVVIDLSRIGSQETKALLMGILVMRLSEHRMAFAKEANADLQHVTVLEEAHNILRANNSFSTEDGGNVAGKSVEMIANAIAEMRTYGEGFIIADQSPGAVDISAIRNTNTKIIMRLPEETDRRVAGKAAALKEEQLDELARLPMGVAAVYQNDWIEPVLCQIEKYNGTEKPYMKKDSADCNADNKKAKKILINWIAKNRLDNPDRVESQDLNWAIEHSDCSAGTKMKLYALQNEQKYNGRLSLWQKEEFSKQAHLVHDILNVKDIVERAKRMSPDMISFNCYMNSIIAQQLEAPSDEEIVNISHCLLKTYAEKCAEGMEYYKKWHEEVVERGRIL